MIVDRLNKPYAKEVPITQLAFDILHPAKRPWDYDVLKKHLRGVSYDVFYVAHLDGASQYDLLENDTVRLNAMLEINQESDGKRFSSVKCLVFSRLNACEELLSEQLQNEFRCECDSVEKGAFIHQFAAAFRAATDKRPSMKMLVDLLAQGGYSISYSALRKHLRNYDAAVKMGGVA